MVKAEREVDLEYGCFVKERLSEYTPRSERDLIVWYEYDKNEQIVVDHYKRILAQWRARVTSPSRRREYVEQRTASFKVFFWVLSLSLIVLSGVFFGLLLGDGWELAGFVLILFVAGGFGLPILSEVVWPYFIHEFDTFDRTPDAGTEDGIKTKEFKDEFNRKIRMEFPEPKKPDNYPKGKPSIKKTKPAARISDDKHYDAYVSQKRKYQTEVTCPICNCLFQFPDGRKSPFEDKCEACDYDFTFIYKKRYEKWIGYVFSDGSMSEEMYSIRDRGGASQKKKTFYIEYDGIQPTRPRAPFKGKHISDAERKPIPQDVKDKVWRRDEGKCVNCGSNENLEFDHIIPASKGGANTYRNIQLLCEVCNREKSDNIG